MVGHRRTRAARDRAGWQPGEVTEPAAGPPGGQWSPPTNMPPPPPPPPGWQPNEEPVAPGRTIGGRLGRILALPFVAVVGLLSVVVVNDFDAYQTSTRATAAVELTLQVQDLVQELQVERGIVSGLLGGNAWFTNVMADARTKVDAEVVDLRANASGTAQGADQVRKAVTALSDLASVRERIDSKKITRAAAFTYYTRHIAALNGIDFGLDRVSDQRLRRAAVAMEELGQIKETTAQERAFLNGVFAAGGFKGKEYVQFSAIQGDYQAALDRFHRYANPYQKWLLDKSLDTGAAREAAAFREVAVAAGAGRRFVVDPQSWWSALTTVLDDMREVEEEVGEGISIRAHNLQIDATWRLGLLLALVAICVIGAIILVVTAARSITRPLAALATEADAVASRRLPDAVTRAQGATEVEDLPPPEPVRVPARASQEIHSVAAALDRVQHTAYALATEQALLRRSTTESLANLGRRNQNLLRRQLGFITQLEREETDPAGLANLFELDHLATRMRRNAESVLVLVGEGAPRSWATPLPVADVLRAAISEVEEYRRVQLRRIDDAWIGGQYVASIAHMVAELVENGLSFSPPDVDVEIQGRQLPGKYLIAVTDQGIGMEEAELIRANERLRGGENFLTAPTRYLGHYVVGHLARQMDIDVQLAQSPVTGITARVTLPGTVLASRPSVTSGSAGDGAHQARQAPPAPEPQTSYARQPEPAAPAAASQWTADSSWGDPLTDSSWGQTDTSWMDAPVPDTPRAILATPVSVVEYVTAPGDSFAQPTTHIPVVGTPATGGDRTANGLLKRQPRSRAAQPGPAVPQQPAAPRAAEMDSSPAEVRSRLTSLRAGILRGENDTSMGLGAWPGSDAEGGSRAR
ncbi:sensor histidine kinase [Luedemannella flava]|uniref:sensor histidine kinase n=1 Tax=Luedemannella flava TaxID=349316 RepID=UPI0031D68CC0